MRKVTLRSLWEHKRRLISTVVAVALGVAFMSGTRRLRPDPQQGLRRPLRHDQRERRRPRAGRGAVLERSSRAATSGRPSTRPSSTTSPASTASPPPCPTSRASASADATACSTPTATPSARATARRRSSSRGSSDDELNPFELTEGSSAPEADDEIVLNVAAAEDGEFELGDTVTVASQFGNVDYTLVGTARFGDADSAAGAVNALFTLPEAQRLAGRRGHARQHPRARRRGREPGGGRPRHRPGAPRAGARSSPARRPPRRTPTRCRRASSSSRSPCTIFSVIALIVGTFIIANTFQILVAQRTRELALLRAVGASRGQVLRSVLLEATVVGLVASVVGIAVGIGLAAGITALLDASGADLPSTGLVIAPSTIVQGLLVGPVRHRARRHRAGHPGDPGAAARGAARRRRRPVGRLEAPAHRRHRRARPRRPQPVARRGRPTATPTPSRPSASAPCCSSSAPSSSGRCSPGRACAPSARCCPGSAASPGGSPPRTRPVRPKRTAATASALIIGVALIGFVTVFAASAKKSVSGVVDTQVNADLIVQPSGGFFGGFGGFSPEVARHDRRGPRRRRGVDVRRRRRPRHLSRRRHGRHLPRRRRPRHLRAPRHAEDGGGRLRRPHARWRARRPADRRGQRLSRSATR